MSAPTESVGGWRAAFRRVKLELSVWRRVIADPRLPRWRRRLLKLALAWLLSPVDLVPDWIPVLGWLDDALVVPLLVWLALRHLPPEIVADARAAAVRETMEGTR